MHFTSFIAGLAAIATVTASPTDLFKRQQESTEATGAAGAFQNSVAGGATPANAVLAAAAAFPFTPGPGPQCFIGIVVEGAPKFVGRFLNGQEFGSIHLSKNIKEADPFAVDSTGTLRFGWIPSSKVSLNPLGTKDYGPLYLHYKKPTTNRAVTCKIVKGELVCLSKPGDQFLATGTDLWLGQCDKFPVEKRTSDLGPVKVAAVRIPCPVNPSIDWSGIA